jgi:hypothetical protein
MRGAIAFITAPGALGQTSGPAVEKSAFVVSHGSTIEANSPDAACVEANHSTRMP